MNSSRLGLLRSAFCLFRFRIDPEDSEISRFSRTNSSFAFHRRRMNYIDLAEHSRLAIAVHLPRPSNRSQRMGKMKSKSLLAAAIVLLIPSLALARPKNSANVELDQAVEVAGTQLAPGQYKLTWEGSGPNVTVNFDEGRKTVVTASAKLVKNPTNQEAIETDTAAGNTTVLKEIDLKNISIQFEDAAPSAGN